ncbi:sugar transferase [Virgibacillus halodenitrificans]|nr:sugar transferase [Virgibacillus halodenitrificans]
MLGSKKRRIQLTIKRLLDICAALFALTICSPIYLIVALYIKINTNEQVLFKQKRAGLNGKSFICLKFRTMTSEADSDGNFLPDEFRLKKWGKFLRSTSLDELPQFINVLKGDMSLIGPRALLVRYLSRYTQEQMRRHEMRPGMTSWTAVNGRNNVDWEKKFKMDVWYIDNWSLLLDFKIFFLTFYTVFKRDGISKTGHATRDEFLGTKDNCGKAN